MTDVVRAEKLREMAEGLANELIESFEFLTVSECADEYDMEDITQEEMEEVYELVTQAEVILPPN